MKATLILSLCFSIIVLSFSSCDEDSSDEDDGGAIFTSSFDYASDLNLWTQSAGGEAVIEQDHLKLKANSGCFVFETVDFISVEKGKSYTLKFKGKVDPPQIGDPAHCVGYFMVYIVQGSDYLIEDGFGDYPDWTQKSYGFEAPTSAGVRIRFMIGTEKGAWLDDLELIQN